jgi:PAS domain S-box-containing protein
VTDRKEAEEALRKSEQRFKELYDNAPVGYHEYDVQGRITSVNRTELEMLGYTLDEMIGQAVWKFILEENLSRQAVLDKLTGALPPARGLERTYRRKDGTAISVLIEDRLLRDSEGTIIGIRSTIQDITERRRAEGALRESEERYRTILENIEDGYFEVDITGNFTFFNDSLCRMLGYTKDELMGVNNRQYMDKETAKKVYQVFNQLYTGGEHYKAFAWEIIRKDGTKRFHDSSVSLIRNAKGEGIGFRGISRDITERKQAEEEREKMIGDLKEALSQVKTLSGFIPICASCKKIRDDKGYWNQIESYIRDHSEAEFSHGICPDCMKKLYPDEI